jgi:hypothetical protein
MGTKPEPQPPGRPTDPAEVAAYEAMRIQLHEQLVRAAHAYVKSYAPKMELRAVRLGVTVEGVRAIIPVSLTVPRRIV